MQRIKVVVANRPRLMRELVLATISDQPDIEVTGEMQDDANLMEFVDQCQPDFLIVALDESEKRPCVCDQLLARYPHLKILALAPERNSSMLFWATIEISSNRIETSEEGILNALRGRIPNITGAQEFSASHNAN